MTEKIVEGFANTIEIILKEGRRVEVVDGEVIGCFGLKTLDSLVCTPSLFSGELIVRCVSVKERKFRVVFKSNQVSDIYSNTSLLAANEYVESAKWGPDLWPVGPLGSTAGVAAEVIY